MWRLLQDLCDASGTNGAAAFTDRKAQTFVHRDGLAEFDRHNDVVTRHHHFGAGWQLHGASHVGGAEEELRTVVVEERLVTAAFFFLQDVHLTFEVGVRRD